MKLLRTALLPPPSDKRGKPTVKQALSVILFVLLFGLICLLMDVTDFVLFTRLWPFVLILFAPWVWWMHVVGYAGLRGWRGQVSLWARFVLLALIIVVLTEPRRVRSDDRLTVVFAVDVSASIDDGDVQGVMNYVLRTGHTEKPSADNAALVYFGRSATVALPPGPTMPIDDTVDPVSADVDHDGTDLSKALSLAAAMVPQETHGRVVLVSDGVETDGNLLNVLDDLKAKGIPVDVLPVRREPAEEVWLERLELPRVVKEEDTFDAAVILSSLQDGEGTLVLFENNQEINRAPVKYEAGKKRFTVSLPKRGPGYYEYKAVIEPSEKTLPNGTKVKRDKFAENNVAIGHLYLEGKSSVLLVTDPEGDPLDYRDLHNALRAAGRDVTIKTSFEMPRDPLGLLPYEAIVLVNTPRDSLDEAQLQSIHDAVKDQASGLLMVGGPQSFGPGGWARSPVEKALPVDMDIRQRKVLPKGALAIILHTCEFAQGNTWAKRITKKAIEVLNPLDEVGVLIFDWKGSDRWLFKLRPAEEREDMFKLINGAQPADMPDFRPTMQLGLIGLRNSDAASKHMIIISDADPVPPPPSMLQQFVNEKISISTIAINPHIPQDMQVMANISALTGGTFYPNPNPAQLPQIFIKEAKTLRRSQVQEVTFTPMINDQRGSNALVGLGALQPLDGYVLTSVKPSNKVSVLLARENEEEVDPVLAKWRYGTGQAAVFTSDLAPRWSTSWVTWNKYQQFVQQLITDIARVTKLGTLKMRSYAAGGEGVIIVEDYSAEEAFLQIAAHVEGPDNTRHELALRQVGPNRYEGRFPLSGQGRYSIRAKAAGRDDIIPGAFVVPYSLEYMRFRHNPIVLDTIVERTGGRVLTVDTDGEMLYDDPRAAKQSSGPIVGWLLVLLACLIPLDVGMRRVQIDWSIVMSWFATRKEDHEQSEEVFSALLQRRRDVKTEIADAHGGPVSQTEGESLVMEEEAAVEEKTASLSLAEKAKLRAKQAAEDAKAKPAEDDSMTSRLLAAKKRARGKQPDE